jgi:hypothetical protein
MLLLYLVLIVTLLCCGCASTGESDFRAAGASFAGNFAFETTVFIDQAQDKEVAWQIGAYAALLAEKSRAQLDIAKAAPVYIARIKVVQRSYVERLSIKTSIFGELCVYGPGDDNTVLLRHSYYYTGRDTVLSARMQALIVHKLLATALKGEGSV